MWLGKVNLQMNYLGYVMKPSLNKSNVEYFVTTKSIMLSIYFHQYLVWSVEINEKST